MHFGPLSALADDHSTDPRTAGDINVGETGIILNEPCSCTPGGRFDAVVQFSATNTTGTGRYCIALHLPAAGGVVQQDVILYTTVACALSGGGTGCSSTVPANRTIPMYGLIKGVPCSAGEICFSTGTPTNRGKCAAGACVTVAFSTTPNAAGCALDANGQAPNFPNGQCRHQQICIIGYGATLTCGGTAVLRATVAGGKSPYVFTLAGSDGSLQTYLTSGTTTDTSHDFSVTVTQDTDYTFTVTDSTGCKRTATTSLSATPVAKPLLSKTSQDCAGNVTITVTNCDTSLSYVWKDNGTVIAGASGCTLTQQFAAGSHSITVTASSANGACSATSDALAFTVNPPVTVSLAQTAAGCDGNVTLIATGGGGNGSYTFAFSGASGTASGNTITLAPQLNGECRVVSVTATSAGCTSAPASYSFRQCVTTTVCP